MPQTQAIAIILARAGSKGVPGKNRAMVGGRTCIAWTIDAANAAKTVARVVVSTDDPELARLADESECEVVERPADLASDTATVDDAARHALNIITGGDGRRTDKPPEKPAPRRAGLPASTPIVILYANVPVRPAGLIDRAVELLVSSGADSVQSYQPVGKHHPWWTARVDAASGQVRPWEGDVLNHGVFRRQDLPPAFIPDGGVLVVTRRALFHEVPGVAAGPHAFFGADRRGIINPEGSVVDIDSQMDLLVADTLLRQGSQEARPSGRA